MRAGLDRLADLQRRHGSQVIIALMPDMNTFTDYPFGFVGHPAARGDGTGWAFVDLLPLFQGRNASDFWVTPRTSIQWRRHRHDRRPPGPAAAGPLIPMLFQLPSFLAFIMRVRRRAVRLPAPLVGYYVLAASLFFTAGGRRRTR